MNPCHWLLRAARADPSRVAIYEGERPWATYGELAAKAASGASALREGMGLEAGDRVALVMKN